MHVHTIPYDSGLVALAGDLHCDSHERAGLDPIEAGGLADLPWTRLDALIVTGDLANSPYPWEPRPAGELPLSKLCLLEPAR